MKNRPFVTLFMLMSVDGKISTGAVDDRDFDRDLPDIAGVSEGLHQYYEIEQETDLWSLNSGRVQQKMGVNQKPLCPSHSVVNFVIMDNRHLTRHGIEYFCSRSNQFVLVTSKREHPAFLVTADNLHILCYDHADPEVMLQDLREQFGCERLTVQTGSTLNGLFLRKNCSMRWMWWWHLCWSGDQIPHRLSAGNRW